MREPPGRTSPPERLAPGAERKAQVQQDRVRPAIGRKLEFFGAGCPLAGTFQQGEELGACGTGEFEVVDVNGPASRSRATKYDVRLVPTPVIDGKTQVEGRIGAPWNRSDEVFAMRRRKCPMVEPE